MKKINSIGKWRTTVFVAGAAILLGWLLSNTVVAGSGQSPQSVPNSYAPVDDKESFTTVHDRMVAAKAAIMKAHMDLLEERYDLSNRPSSTDVMDRTKPLQEGVRVKLAPGLTWNLMR